MITGVVIMAQVVWRLWFKPVTDAREQLIWDYLLFRKEFSQ